jgi:hypothetical protein
MDYRLARRTPVPTPIFAVKRQSLVCGQTAARARVPETCIPMTRYEQANRH